MKYVKYIIISLVFVFSGIIYAREVPLLKRWILNKIQLLSREKAGMEVKAQAVNFTLFPPGVEFEKISMTLKEKGAQQTVAPISIGKLGISLSPLAFLSGRFEIGKISLIHPTTSIFLKKSAPSEGNSKPFRLPWNDIMNIPVRKLVIKDADIQARIDDLSLFLKVQKFGLNFEKDSGAAKIEVFSPHTLIKLFQNEASLAELGLATRVILEEQAAEVSAIKINSGDSFIMARGVTRGDITKLNWNNIKLHVISHLNLQDMAKKFKIYVPTLSLPELAGHLNFEVIGSQKKGDPALASAEIDTQDLGVNAIKVGNIHSKLKLVNNQLTSDQLSLKTTAGNVLLKDFSMSLGPEAKIATRIQSDGMELKQTLINVGVGTIPLHMDVALKAACEGVYSPKYKIECAGESEGKNFKISTSPENKTIAALKDFKIVTRFILEKEVMTFPEGEIHIGSSVGKADGFVDFEKGFSFNFDTSALSFKDVQSLADLKYEGVVRLHGNTKGNGHTATIETHMGMTDFWFENYGLGKGEFDLKYEKSHLYFANLSGTMKNTAYDGDIDLKLNKPTNITANLNFTKLNLADLKNAFSRKVTLPFTVDGQGVGKINLSGPLSLSELSYTLTSKFTSGVVYDEGFQNLIFNVHGVQGHAYTDNVSLNKGDGTMTLKGDVTPNGIMSLFVKGQDTHLSDFDHIRTSASGLDGVLHLDLSLQDKILNPRISMRGLISQTTLVQEPLEDSNFSFELTPESMALTANIFANQLKAALVQPRVGNGLFSFKFNAENWDFSQLLSMVSGSDFKKDYETSVTAKVNLVSDNGDFWESRGEIRIPKFYVRHGTYQMQNADPMIIKFNDGSVNAENFTLKGDNTQVTFSGSRNKKNNLNVNINGHLELSLFTFLTPFFNDMRGSLNLSAQIAGTTTRPEFLGTALVSKGYFKLKEFIHPFEDINADILFSQSRVVVNKIKGILGGGELEAGGSVLFRAPKDVPIDISGSLSRATLTVPEGLTTKGSGNFSITGNWYPYLLHAEYNIDSGLYTKSFGEQETNMIVKRNAFLPTNISQKQSYPLNLDLITHFQKGVAVRNSLLESEVKGDMQVTGEPQHVILKGEINTLPNGKLFFRDTPFNINLAKVKFNSPNENNPNIYLLATSRVSEWDITLLYQGNLENHELKLTSSPPLSERSIVSLLALGVTDDNLEKNKSSDQLALQGYQAGSVILATNPLIQDFKKKTGVTVRLSSTVDETRNIVMPRFIAEKQWTPNFITSVSRTIGDKSAKNLNAEYKFNRNFSVLGTYEQRDYDQFSVSNLPAGVSAAAPSVQPAITENILGLDLQYQMEFR